MKRIIMLLAVAAFLAATAIPAAMTAPLPDNCTKNQGVISCTTTTSTSPGKNMGGVTFSEEETTTVKGNFSAASPGGGQTTSTTEDCGGPKAGGNACPKGQLGQ